MESGFLTDILERKRREVAEAQAARPEAAQRGLAEARTDQRPFFDRLAAPGRYGVNVIAEVKRASPSKGVLRADLDAAELARAYERGGAAAISVLTDARYFKGSLDDLRQARAATTLPVLRKDFVVCTYQVYESAAMGADAVLLIARVLAPALLRECVEVTEALGLAPLVEVHSQEDLQKANEAGARLIGVNSRDLATFETDLSVVGTIAALVRPDQILVAESGIKGRADLESLLALGVHNFLIGESLVRAADAESFLRALIGREPAAT